MTELKDMKPVQLFVEFSKEMQFDAHSTASKVSSSLTTGAAMYIMRAGKSCFSELAIYLEKYVPIDLCGVKDGWLTLLNDNRIRNEISVYPEDGDIIKWVAWLRQHAE